MRNRGTEELDNLLKILSLTSHSRGGRKLREFPDAFFSLRRKYNGLLRVGEVV